MNIVKLTSVLFRGVAVITMMLALMAQPIIETIDLMWDTDIALTDIESQQEQEQEEEQQEKDGTDEKIKLFAYDSTSYGFYSFIGTTNDYTRDHTFDFSLEINIPPPRI